jgi:hypothetical protein
MMSTRIAVREDPRVASKRTENERKFGHWEDAPLGGRRYWVEVPGRAGWRARYVKEVDAQENTLRFWQEIYNPFGALTEVHEKFPVDRGHQAPRGRQNDD